MPCSRGVSKTPGHHACVEFWHGTPPSGHLRLWCVWTLFMWWPGPPPHWTRYVAACGTNCAETGRPTRPKRVDSAGGLASGKHLILGSGASPPTSPQRSRNLHAGTGWHPVGLAQPDRPVPRGQDPAPPPAELAMLAPGAPGGSPWGGRRDATPHFCRLNARVSPSRRSAGVRGGERPRWFHYLCPTLRRTPTC
jgi:hypothetical protein